MNSKGVVQSSSYEPYPTSQMSKRGKSSVQSALIQDPHYK